MPNEIEEIMKQNKMKNVKFAGPGALSRSMPGEILRNIMSDKELKKDFLEFCYWYDSQPFVAGLGKDNIIERAASFRVPKQKDALNLSERMKERGGSYFTFIDKQIPSTNNAAEQAIRAIVLDRKATQGSRSEWGSRWMERFWSVLTTCRQQGRPVIDFLEREA
jgi:hypothetical protein